MSRSAAATVLTVEDDPIVRRDLRLVLETAGFEVLPDARDGEEAVDLARRHSPDVIVLDLGLPRVDGAEATRRIREERDVPVIGLTGHRDGELLERASEAGVGSYVFKPFGERELVGAVTEAVRNAAPRLEGVREESHAALAHVLDLLGYPAGWATDLERRSFAAGKVWRLERRGTS